MALTDGVMSVSAAYEYIRLVYALGKASLLGHGMCPVFVETNVEDHRAVDVPWRFRVRQENAFVVTLDRDVVTLEVVDELI